MDLPASKNVVCQKAAPRLQDAHCLHKIADIALFFRIEEDRIRRVVRNAVQRAARVAKPDLDFMVLVRPSDPFARKLGMTWARSPA